MYVFEQHPYLDDIKYMEDRSCCTVVALAIVLNISYLDAYKLMEEKIGRKKGRGLTITDIEKISELSPDHKATKLGHPSVKSKMTIGRFCKENPIGTFYVLTHGHAIAIKDGVVYDSFDKPRRLIKWAMQFEKIT